LEKLFRQRRYSYIQRTINVSEWKGQNWYQVKNQEYIRRYSLLPHKDGECITC